MNAFGAQADQLTSLYNEMSVLLQSDDDTTPGLVALIQEYGAENVKWMLGVLSEELGVSFPA